MYFMEIKMCKINNIMEKKYQFKKKNFRVKFFYMNLSSVTQIYNDIAYCKSLLCIHNYDVFYIYNLFF